MTQDAEEPDRAEKLALCLIAALMFALHVAAVFTENVNWDELALFRRVAELVRTGNIQGGGRPGIVEILLVPLVRECTDVIWVVRQARLWWAGVVLLGVVGLYRLLLALRAERREPNSGAMLGVALYTLALPFLRWSLQVRTDQLSVALGVWGGVALLASAQRRWLSLLAGLCLGIGFLASQKVLYVAGLLGLAVVGHTWARGPGALRAESRSLLARAAGCALGFALIFALYRFGLPLFYGMPKLATLESGMRVLAGYRKAFGMRLHWGMLAALKPHLVLIALLLMATIFSLRKRQPLRRYAVCWALLAGAFLVAAFHSAMFPYFWMTLGLFPAVALGYGLEEISAVIPARLRWPAALALSGALGIPALLYSALLLDDSQKVQRDAFSFVEHELPDRYGFQIEGGLFCTKDPDPFRTMFREHIDKLSNGPRAQVDTAAFLARFRKKPVSFLIESHMLPFFPEAVRNFWAENYQQYRGPVYLAGKRLVGSQGGAPQQVSLFVSGTYRWLTSKPAPTTIQVDGMPIAHLGTVQLPAGEHAIVLPEAVEGVLVLATQAPPEPPTEYFYPRPPIQEIVGGSYW